MRGRATTIVAAIALAVLAGLDPAQAQVMAPGAGVQAGDGSLPVLPPRRSAQGWATEASVTSQATLTNNANYGLSDVREGDLVLEVIPALRFNREGARLRVDGSVALDMIGYAGNTQVSRVLPRADVLASLEAIERFFFVDASLFVSQFLENPFLPSSQSASTNNLYTSTTARIAPYFKGNFGPDVSWLVRSDNSFTYTSQSDNPLANAYYARNLAEVARSPIPFGVTLRLTNELTRIQDQKQPDQTLNTALAIFDYAFTPQLTLGLRGGYESTTYTASETSGPIYGANIAWRPSPLTSLVGYWEERFYGPSYQFDFSHRQRRLASSVSAYRTITTYPQLLLQIPPTSSVSGLLDAILIARFPDPLERSRAVQDLITRQGLPQSLPSGANVYNQSANILTGGSLNWALIGVRNTLALNLFYLKTEYLPDARVPPTFLAFNNNIQRGAGLTLTHFLTPVVTLNGTASTRFTTGFDANEGLDSRQRWFNLQANWQLSPRSTMFLGGRYQLQTASDPLSFTESSEAAVFVGLFHRL